MGPAWCLVACALGAACGATVQTDSDANGHVDELYTFGAPYTANPPLEDGVHEGGVFPGARVFTEDPEHHKVDMAPILDDPKVVLHHAKMKVLKLHTGDVDLWRVDVDSPKDDGLLGDNALHKENLYMQWMQAAAQRAADVAADPEIGPGSLLAKFAAWSYYKKETIKSRLLVELPRWKIVGDAIVTFSPRDAQLKDTDPIRLYQDQDTLKCALVFTGTNFASELAETMDYSQGTFCGIGGVRAKYANELRRIMYYVWPYMRPKIGKCSGLAVAGHSLGGAIAEMFAACANSGKSGEADYDLQSWVRGKPELLPEVQADETLQVVGNTGIFL